MAPYSRFSAPVRLESSCPRLPSVVTQTSVSHRQVKSQRFMHSGFVCSTLASRAFP
ncbi:hypothetical protein ACRRTK_016593 [Alexandromys fortis]